LAAQGQLATTYDNIPPIVDISSGLAPKIARPEEGGQRDLSEDQRHHDVFGEASSNY
jgi:hypothetical protein